MRSARLGHLTLLLTVLSATQITAADLDKAEAAKTALDKVKGLIDTAKQSTIVSNVKKYGPVVGLSGAAVMDTISFIKTLLPNGIEESKELVYLKEQFAIVNTKLDALDHDFEEVKHLIDWNSMRTNVMQYENAIKALEGIFLIYLDAPVSAKPIFEEMFKDSYYYELRDAPLKLYNFLASDGGIFQENIFKTLRKRLKNNLAQIAEFAGYILRLINRGLVLQYAFLTMEDDKNHIKELNETWAIRFENLTKTASTIDREIMDAWKTQYRKDSDEFAVRNSHLSNNEMMLRLHAILTKKFPWRKWFVLAYTFTNNNDKDRFYDNCGGFSKVNVGNKVVIVNSIDARQTKSKVNVLRFHLGVRRFEGVWSPWEKIARRLFGMIGSDCRYYSFKGVFEEKADVRLLGPKGHYNGWKVRVARHFHRVKPYVMFVFS